MKHQSLLQVAYKLGFLRKISLVLFFWEQYLSRTTPKETLVQTKWGFLRLDPLDKVISKHIGLTGTWEFEETRHFCNLIKPGMTVIDIGANLGWYTLIASGKVGPQGRVFAFEPAKVPYNLLQENRILNGLDNVTIEKLALGSKKEKATLYSSSTNGGGRSLIHYPTMPKKEEVEVTTLDLYTEAHPEALPIDILKIDIEGGEIACLEGAQQAIKKSPNLILLIEPSPKIGSYLSTIGLDNKFRELPNLTFTRRPK